MPLGAGFLAPENPLPGALARIRKLALGCGFSAAAEFNVNTLKVRSEVRDACAADKCCSYGRNWSCPPACGSLEACEQGLRQYHAGLILQTCGQLEDSFDYESMAAIAREHQAHLRALQEGLQPFGDTPSWLLLGSGACAVCETCSYPESPCRFPGKMIVSMEAMGLLVSELCAANSLPYYYGPNTLTYVGCILIVMRRVHKG